MPHFPSPVFHSSLSGWAIEKTKTVIEGVSSKQGQYALRLAVTAVALPIFAVIDMTIYVALTISPRNFISHTHWCRLIRTVLFVVQTPFIFLASLFGTNLPKVNRIAYSDIIWNKGPMFSHDVPMEERVREFQLILNQYRHDEGCNFDELIEFRNSDAFLMCFVENFIYHGINLSKTEYHVIALTHKGHVNRSVIDQILGKNKNKVNSPMSAAQQLILEKTFYNLIHAVFFSHTAIYYRIGNGRFLERPLSTAMEVIKYFDQEFNEKTKQLLLRCVDKFFCFHAELLSGILEYVRSTGDFEFGTAVKAMVQKQESDLFKFGVNGSVIESSKIREYVNNFTEMQDERKRILAQSSSMPSVLVDMVESFGVATFEDGEPPAVAGAVDDWLIKPCVYYL